ncbi:non-canonical purine NTP pyrophosphatase [Paenibacillus puerhi]|uniref:non-canonical purine NTP pyrophosphatase n=1 Tax=Paenibacillus puerhi TaxID=2692622 RepID=UPI001356B162|nr:non-canonical purine NTP pyrophosphatase [Paenibacillus puerhi]
MRLHELRPAQVVIATKNAGKVKEFEAMFGEDGTAVRSLRDYPDIPDIPEDGDSFAANALIKARAVARLLGVPVIADDSGLAVDRLGGAPGVYSARYAGEPANDEANNRKLLDELSKLGPLPAQSGQGLGAEGRAGEQGGPVQLSAAQFICAIAFVDAAGEPIAEVQGECPGAVISERRGEGGFGYDPLFYVPELGRTMAELTMEEKNAVSHRGQALRKLWAALEEDPRH